MVPCLFLPFGATFQSLSHAKELSPDLDGMGTHLAPGVSVVSEAPMGILMLAGSKTFGEILSDGWDNTVGMLRAGRDNAGGDAQCWGDAPPTQLWCSSMCGAPIPTPGSTPCIPPIPQMTHAGSC